MTDEEIGFLDLTKNLTHTKCHRQTTFVRKMARLSPKTMMVEMMEEEQEAYWLVSS
jgi:hypothetical protein